MPIARNIIWMSLSLGLTQQYTWALMFIWGFGPTAWVKDICVVSKMKSFLSYWRNWCNPEDNLGQDRFFVVWGSLGLRSMLKTNRKDMHSSSTWFITCQNVPEKKAREGGRKAATAEEKIIFLAVPQFGCQWCFKVAGTKTLPNPISLNIISSSYLMLTVLLPHFPGKGRDHFCITRT